MSRVSAALDAAVSKLLLLRNAEGYWEGRLSSSALSTATALSALAVGGAVGPNSDSARGHGTPDASHAKPELFAAGARESLSSVAPTSACASAGEPLRTAEASNDHPHLTSPIKGEGSDADLIASGLAWLAETQCEDGGWGDTPDSPSNLSTTLLVLSAFTLCQASETPCLSKAKAHVEAKTGGRIAETITAHYGKDRTFAVPILMNCALAGLVPWSAVPSLPFELAVVPPRLYRLMKLQVVSYALPALIAVGLVIHVKKGSRNLIRRASGKAVLRRLAKLQPSHGGFLDATPLTSFVAMSLAGASAHLTSRRRGGKPEPPTPTPSKSDSPQATPWLDPPCAQGEGDVLRKALEFIRRSVREDGSWPIDTDLAAWVTSSAVNALAHAGGIEKGEWDKTKAWLLDRQTQAVHPFTNAAPGGWPWTDKEGGVPDGDDTSGAILALCALDGASDATMAGAQWLIDLQNADGGWPTFCRGWGKLPFDQSSPDITAHAIRALRASRHPRAAGAVTRGLRYLEIAQRTDGSWVPLWFGSQRTPGHANPVLGTSRALMAYGESQPAAAPTHPPHVIGPSSVDPTGIGPEKQAPDRVKEGASPYVGPVVAGVRYLLSAQNPDGSWGADRGIPGTMEETALAVTALCHIAAAAESTSELKAALLRGAECLADGVEAGGLDRPSPIGLYFASLWYSERLYPVVWAVEALGRAVELGKQDQNPAPR